jgi:tripartite-type tricarboxylate transporter receptor subunit TctC
MWLTGRIAIKAETTQCRTGLETSLGASMTTWQNLVAGCLATALLSFVGHDAWPQTRTLKIVVASSPGGVNEIMARLLAEQIGRVQGPTVVVENRPGAGEAIGTEAVARAAPDGNTVLIAANPFLINPQMRKAGYDPLSSFEPICHLVSSPTIIVVNSSSSYRTLGDLIEAARARPGELTLASVGPGSPFHLGFEVLKRAAKIDMTFVPYPGNAPSVNALLGGHVTSMFGTYPNVAEQLRAGQLRALAVATRSRIEPLPEVPTVAESGYKDYEVDAWFGVFAPAKTPAETLSQLAGWFTAALALPEVKARLAVQGLYPVGACGADFGARLRKQYEEYGRIIKDARISGE